MLDHTPFYAESGGQAGDQGVLANAATRFVVADTLKVQADVIGHHGTLEQGTLKVGDVLRAEIDAHRRACTQRNHSATHLMHKALREVLGAHVQQKGSLVDAEKTRFDFAHNAPMTDDEIRRVEQIVNNEILANAPGIVRVMPYDEAVKGGAMALFGEKYGDEVRVLDLGFARIQWRYARASHRRHRLLQDRRRRRRRGRHPPRRGDHRRQRGALRAGTRRAREGRGRAEGAAVGATQRIAQVQDQAEVAREGAGRAEVEARVEPGRRFAQQAVEIGGVFVLAATLDGADAKTLRETVDKLKDKLKSAAIVLAAVEGGKVSLIAGVTPDASKKVKAGGFVNFVAQQVGGKGGGRPDMAQAGGTEPANLPGALAGVKGWVEERL